MLLSKELNVIILDRNRISLSALPIGRTVLRRSSLGFSTLFLAVIHNPVHVTGFFISKGVGSLTVVLLAVQTNDARLSSDVDGRLTLHITVEPSVIWYVLSIFREIMIYLPAFVGLSRHIMSTRGISSQSACASAWLVQSVSWPDVAMRFDFHGACGAPLVLWYSNPG